MISPICLPKVLSAIYRLFTGCYGYATAFVHLNDLFTQVYRVPLIASFAATPMNLAIILFILKSCRGYELLSNLVIWRFKQCLHIVR